jgi:hypothetical protein
VLFIPAYARRAAARTARAGCLPAGVAILVWLLAAATLWGAIAGLAGLLGRSLGA